MTVNKKPQNIAILSCVLWFYFVVQFAYCLFGVKQCIICIKIIKRTMERIHMKFLPILDELFSSDSIIFMIIGLIIAVIISLKIKDIRKCFAGMAAGFIVYVVCEVISNIRTNNALEMALLFGGTVAIGLFVGFLIGAVGRMVRER